MNYKQLKKKMKSKQIAFSGEKYIIIDRTFSDQIAHYYWNTIYDDIEDKWDCGNIAEYVQYFQDLFYGKVCIGPFKIDKNNDERLANLSNITITTVYGDKVKEYGFDYLQHND